MFYVGDTNQSNRSSRTTSLFTSPECWFFKTPKGVINVVEVAYLKTMLFLIIVCQKWEKFQILANNRVQKSPKVEKILDFGDLYT